MDRVLASLSGLSPAGALFRATTAPGMTRGAFLDRVEALTSHLAGTPGPVALALDNSQDWLAADIALGASGHVNVPVPPWFTPAQIAHLVEAAGLSAWLGVRPPPVPHGKGRPLGGGLNLWRLEGTLPAALPPGTGKITFTSGTTGQPKGVCLANRSLETIAESLARIGRQAGVGRHLCALPLAVLLENIAGAWAAMLAGAEIVAPPMAELGMAGATGVDAGRFLAAIRQHEAHSLILVPQLLEALVGALEAGATPPGCLRFVAVGGARVPPALLARARRLGLPVHEGYGLSECGSVVSLDLDADERAGVGRALPHARVSLAPDGEILVAGELMLGYAGDPSPVPRPWPTGDLGSLDASGRLHIIGRKRNVFITSMGRNISPEWVETELLQEPPVRQAAVFGEGMRRPVAVLFAPGADEAAVAAAVERANLRLPDYARIGRWLAAAEPFSPANGMATANGRLRRGEIADRYRCTPEAGAAFEFLTTENRLQ
jgi:long-chain acyl-CoA synthetase